jgi:hypothetical protein
MVAVNKPLDLLVAFFSRNGWPCMKLQDGVLVGLMRSDTGRWDWRALADGEVLRLYSVAPVNVPRRRRGAVMEYLTRANWGLSTATLEMDLSDGQVICRTTVPTRGVTRQGIEYLVHGNFSAIDRYLPGLLKVIYGQASPRRAVLKAEADPSDAPESDGGGGETELPVRRAFPFPSAN